MGNSIDMNEMKPVARPLLPVIFVLDASGSMQGQPISMLNHAMEEVKNILGRFAASNSDALLKIGILQFASDVQWVQPKGLEEFEDFEYNPLKAGGLTAMGAALKELDEKLSRNAFLTSTTGRCAPIIIFMTDGFPTDDNICYWKESLKKLRENKWYRFAIKIGFAVGDDADCQMLSEVVGNSEAVIQTNDLNTFNKLLQKVAINSAMIGSKSHTAGEMPSGEDIIRAAIKETDQGDKAQTAGDLGIHVTDSNTADDDPNGVWGSDDWN